MTDLATAPPAPIYTTWGTVLYVDSASGQLRHGPVDTSPSNAVFVADRTAAGTNRQGWFMFDAGARLEPIACGALSCRAVSRASGGDPPPTPTLLDLVPLERGLIAFSAGGLFLCAQPDGRIDLVNPLCSTWECFLASEDWCSSIAAAGSEHSPQFGGPAFDKRRIAGFIIDARLRVKANAKSKATKILIYGYPAWSHGRVYYDICKHLHDKGYIVDIINWQVNHAAYMGELISFYDLFISALDGVRTLVEVYRVPCEQVVALSHHEMDIRILIEQMGTGVFEKFAGYGVVSYQLFDASTIFGVPRHPLVVQLGVNFDEFCADIPERLTTVGYAGSYSHQTKDGIEIKRGEIAEAAAREAGLAFKVAGWTGDQISFHDMPEFYKSVDAVLISSVTEGAQMPVKEGAAAGRLVISTPVGDFPLRASQGVGIVAPIESHKYSKFVADTLKYYRENPAAFVEICRKTQDAARQLDWQHVIGDWIELIETAKGYVLEQARSHQQAGSLAEAAGLFAIRAGRGGDDEEKWYARWQHARCLRELGDEKGFVRTALQAFRERPHRAEPLHDLANYYLQTQRAGPAALCAEAALAIPLPEHDVLSVDPGLYETGLRHTFAALASWSQDPEQKERGRKVCDWLALSRDVPAYIRDPARYNSGWYAAPAQTFLPSLQFQPLSIEVFEGFQAGNFGVCRRGDQLILLVRAINWTVQDAYWYVLQGDPPYRNQILLIELDKNLRIVASAHVDAPEDMPSPQTKDHHGFQDPRPFIWRGDLWCLCAVTEFNDRGIAEMVLSRVHCAGPDSYVLRDWRVLPSGMPTQHEKNWMPQIAGDELRLIYSVAPTRILRESGAVLSNEPASIAAETFRGGSQAIPFDDGWLMVVHEVELVNGIKRYFHRFIWMDARNVLRRLSRRFYFRILEQVGPEFVTGLAWHPDDERLVISFATNDADPCLAVVDASDVRAALVEISEHEQASRDVVEGAQAVRDKIVGCYQQDSLVCPIYTSEVPNYDASVIYLESLDQVDGWLEKTTASIISRLLRYQTEIGMRGDVLEVGVHHGRLFLLLALCTVEGERAVAVDLFEDQHLNDSLSGRGDREILERNIRRYAPEATVEILRANSMDLGQEFIKSHLGLRFISIDGGHTREIACNDLKLAEQLLASGGIVALDDIYRTDWSGVTAGLHKYYMDGGRLIPFALTPNKALFTLDHEYLKDYQIMLTKDFSDVLSRVWAHRQYQQFFGFNDVLSFIESS